MISSLCDTLWIITGSQMSKAVFREAEAADAAQTRSAQWSRLKSGTDTQTSQRPSLHTAGRENRDLPVHLLLHLRVNFSLWHFGIADEVWTTTKGSRFCSLTPRSTKTALGGRWAAPAQHQPPVCPSPEPPQGQQSTGRFFILISRVILPLEKRDHAFSETCHNFLKNVWPLLSVSPFSWTKK